MTSLENFPYLASFIAGILTFVSPCILPIIPIYISFITGVSVNELEKEKASALAKTFLNSLFFVLGFSLVFVMLGATASSFGNLFASHRDLIRWIGGVTVIIFGLHLAGIFKLKFLYMEKKLKLDGFGRGDFGAFFVGIAFAAGWTPCIGPILSAILLIASSQGTVYKGMLLLFLYSMGLGIPFLLTALFIGWALKLFSKIKKYYGYIEAASGIVLVSLGVLLLTDNFRVLSRFIGKFTG